ncbi:MAG: hypothetical protein V1738_00425 [Patescibacteria group bacterium]
MANPNMFFKKKKKSRLVAVKILEAVLSVTTRFFSVLIMAGAIYLYVTFIVPPVLWIGRSLNSANAHWQDGGPVLSFFSNEFWTFVALPLAPLVASFLLLSVIVWVGGRNNVELSRRGFRAVVSSLFVLGLLFMVPVRSGYLAYQVEEKRASESASLNVGNFIHTGERVEFETMKIYRALHEAGIATWREDPMSVVKFELEYGELRSLHEDDDELTVLREWESDDSSFSGAEIELTNDRVHKRIDLRSFWQDEHRVWAVTGYSDSPSLILSRIWEEMAQQERSLPYPYRETELGLEGEFAVGELGPKAFREEKERIESDGHILWAGVSGVLETPTAFRQSQVSGLNPPESIEGGPWSEHLFFGDDSYDVWQVSSGGNNSIPFRIFKDGKEYAVFYGEAGADGVIEEARIIGGELAVTYRSAGILDTDLVIGDKIFSVTETVSGARSPFEHDGKVGFVAELGDYDFVMFDGVPVSENFDEIRTLSCCAITSYPFNLYDNGILEFVGRRGGSYFLVEINLNDD